MKEKICCQVIFFVLFAAPGKLALPGDTHISRDGATSIDRPMDPTIPWPIKQIAAGHGADRRAGSPSSRRISRPDL